MKVFSYASILVLVLSARRSNGNTIGYDFTDPLNAVRAGNLSADQFSANIISHFGNLTTTLQLAGAYSPDCNIIEGCGSTLIDAMEIFHDVNKRLVQQNLEIKAFNFQFRIEIEAFKNLTNPMNQTKFSLPAGVYLASFTLPEKTTCNDLKNITTEQWRILLNSSTWFVIDSVHQVVLIGLGYNEDLIGCQRLYPALQISKYLVTYLSPCKTPGVPKSFGLFTKKMYYLHARNIGFITNGPHYKNPVPPIDYLLLPQCLGDEYHHHLLESYWKLYNIDNVSTTMPIPLGEVEIPSYSTNKIIPYIDADSGNDGVSVPWYSLAALETLRTYFGAVVLTHVEGTGLKSKAVGGATSAKPDIQLNILMDYTDCLRLNQENPNFNECDYNWSKIERELNELDKTVLQSLENVKVTTLIFPITPALHAKSLSVNISSDFARRMSSQLVIGCGLQLRLLSALHHPNASDIVAACKQVNGSLYTLQNDFKLKSITLVNSQYFENDVRPILEDMNALRNEILVQHPKAKVYFSLRLELQIFYNHATAFCNWEASTMNEYVEAIVNWASINEIPLIMGRAFNDINQQKHHSWFSVLRPTLKDLRYFNPHFMLRNFPNILPGAKVEPCIQSTTVKPTINETYFHNHYLGSMFIASQMRKDKPISVNEYKIVLQFILQRFDVVNVLLDKHSYKDFVIAMNTLASEGLMDHRKWVFITIEFATTKENNFQGFYAFLNFTKLTLGSNISLLKGIFSADWSASDSYIQEHTQEQSLHLLTQQTIAFGWSRSLNINMGVVVPTAQCQNIDLDVASRKHKIKEGDDLLNAAGYLVCTEHVDLKMYNDPKSIGTLFDTHLYVKKFFEDFYPSLDVVFEVIVKVQSTESLTNEYLILLSYFKQFANIYNISYLIVQAFDWEKYPSSGWWKISNDSNLILTSIYEEKYSASVGSKTWRPPLHLKPNQTTKATNDNKQNIILVVSSSGFGIMIVVLGFVIWHYKNKKPQYMSYEEEREFYNGKEDTGEGHTSRDSEYLKFDKQFELTFADICFDPKDCLGRGNFGTVYKGLVKEEPVAIKKPNENCPATSFKSVLCEIKVLCYIGTHSNVVQFIGAYTKEIRNGVLYIATELCSNGSLDGFLRKKKRVVSNTGDADDLIVDIERGDAVYFHDLHRLAKEIANGMEYIAGENVIHGDLSARNVLLDENFTCKIGDFGLSRKLYEYLEYVKQSQEPLPWKWMAFESLKNMQFTTKSDVWSYGVTLWEIYSLGSVPYGGLSWTTGFTDDLKNGLKLQIPEYATDEVYKTMLACWNIEPNERPGFTAIVEFYKHLTSCEYTTLEI